MAVVTDKQFYLLGGAAVIVAGLVVWKLRQVGEAVSETASAAVETTKGVLSGNNELTAETPYEGAGVLGTLGASADYISGGTLRSFGEWSSMQLYDLLN